MLNDLIKLLLRSICYKRLNDQNLFISLTILSINPFA